MTSSASTVVSAELSFGGDGAGRCPCSTTLPLEWKRTYDGARMTTMRRRPYPNLGQAGSLMHLSVGWLVAVHT